MARQSQKLMVYLFKQVHLFGERRYLLHQTFPLEVWSRRWKLKHNTSTEIFTAWGCLKCWPVLLAPPWCNTGPNLSYLVPTSFGQHWPSSSQMPYVHWVMGLASSSLFQKWWDLVTICIQLLMHITCNQWFASNSCKSLDISTIDWQHYG